MQEEAYAETLFAILTNPHPAGIDPDDPYGRSDDGIDRHDGFGRDYWVESLEIVDGEHGTELLVGFGLGVPTGADGQGVPPHGSLRLPFDAEWRDLSGYEDAAAYAPVVAHRVGIAAGVHAERHRRRPADTGEGERALELPSREEQWEILLGALGGEGTVREVAPGRIELRDSAGGVVTVLVSPDQWERVLVDHAWGDVDLYVAELLGPCQEDERYVVFYDGDLHRSTREKLPPVRGRALERRLADACADHPDGDVGWFAYGPTRPGPGSSS